MAHYYAKRFFAPAILSLYIDHDERAVKVRRVSDSKATEQSRLSSVLNYMQQFLVDFQLAIVSDLPYALTPTSDIFIEALTWQGQLGCWVQPEYKIIRSIGRLSFNWL